MEEGLAANYKGQVKIKHQLTIRGLRGTRALLVFISFISIED